MGVETATTPTEIPYQIDASEVGSGVTVATSVERVSTLDTHAVKEYLPQDALAIVLLLDEGDKVVALDVVSHGVKDTLIFNATNSAKADVIVSLNFWALPRDLMVVAYGRVADHPDFPALVQFYRAAKGAPYTEEADALSVKIASDLAAQLVEEARTNSSQR